MHTIRYTKRVCTDESIIEAFLNETRVGVVSMVDDQNIPYAVPVNFVWYKGSIYFHGMGSGKKERLLLQKPSVCFTLFHEYGTVVDPVPCHADTAYRSVMIFGKAQKLTDTEESALVLQKLLDKYTPHYYKHQLAGSLIEKYRSTHDGKAVSVYKIVPTALTAKENIAQESELFNNEAFLHE
ncbi:pyridoxamine 5'-phosphate oxidase-related, FMN-binding protein [Sulfurospirillum diekertiae]|uniref:Pyridoxamine 5'-phosphate oxidase-related, FMN-binding protein n=1 Tax=Sulfurospirillum diekertiae TaxID=1854492 RepID=A0A290HE51_9BACT|nr:pyridoxamine 5'-phosphate oxidase family protein [Sulfurospirillum diekertiae]ATB69727.1 pyridoxamine 5'-phosphate oxidase-related, FMN-binding protein [Sulfurospirillum diekertiae]